MQQQLPGLRGTLVGGERHLPSSFACVGTLMVGMALTAIATPAFGLLASQWAMMAWVESANPIEDEVEQTLSAHKHLATLDVFAPSHRTRDVGAVLIRHLSRGLLERDVLPALQEVHHPEQDGVLAWRTPAAPAGSGTRRGPVQGACGRRAMRHARDRLSRIRRHTRQHGHSSGTSRGGLHIDPRELRGAVGCIAVTVADITGRGPPGSMRGPRRCQRASIPGAPGRDCLGRPASRLTIRHTELVWIWEAPRRSHAPDRRPGLGT